MKLAPNGLCSDTVTSPLVTQRYQCPSEKLPGPQSLVRHGVSQRCLPHADGDRLTHSFTESTENVLHSFIMGRFNKFEAGEAQIVPRGMARMH